MKENRLLLRVVSEIRQIMLEKRLSSRELEEACKKKGFKKVTRSKIIRAFYIEEGRQFFLNNTDDTIEGVLAATGYTGNDILKRLLNEGNRNFVRDGEGTLPREISDWAKTKEAEPYLKLAYAQYKRAQADKEYERLRKELLEPNPKK